MSIPPASGHSLTHHPPPHPGVPLWPEQRAQRWASPPGPPSGSEAVLMDSSFPDVPPSPLSVHDRYSSPVAGSAKRRLFGDEHPSPGVTHGLTLISPAKRLMIGPSSSLKISTPGSPAALAVPLQGRGSFRHGSVPVAHPPSHV